jgi:hypothetical protein
MQASGQDERSCKAIQGETVVAMRVKGRVQITTDALRTYLNVIEDAFGSEVDFAQLHKVYRSPMENETRYSPAKCLAVPPKT